MEDYYDKKIDIGLKKKQMEDEYGAMFSPDSNLPPEVEMEWLNNIEQFEKQFNTAQKVSVWEFIGKPQYKKAHEIEPEKLSAEVHQLLDLMQEQGVNLDTLCKVNDIELYRFITEELFLYKMDNIKVTGMMSCFIYEEFHPNAEYDIRSAFDYFFRMTMAKMENIGGEGYDQLYVDNEHYRDLKGKKVDKKEVVQRINTFLGSYDYFEISSLEINDVVINKKKTDATLNFEISYKGCFHNSHEHVKYAGKGHMRFRPSRYGGWSAYHINLPGLII